MKGLSSLPKYLFQAYISSAHHSAHSFFPREEAEPNSNANTRPGVQGMDSIPCTHTKHPPSSSNILQSSSEHGLQSCLSSQRGNFVQWLVGCYPQTFMVASPLQMPIQEWAPGSFAGQSCAQELSQDCGQWVFCILRASGNKVVLEQILKSAWVLVGRGHFGSFKWHYTFVEWKLQFSMWAYLIGQSFSWWLLLFNYY